MRSIILVAHNLRSCHNVGSLLRTAEGLGVEQVILSGYTPYPLPAHGLDRRLPHIAAKLDRQISKTALGAEQTQSWRHHHDISKLLHALKSDGYSLAGIEQAANSVPLPVFTPPAKLALIVGREVEGLEPEVMDLADIILEIPMFGSKESYNVVQAAAMAMYHCRFTLHP